ncbi:hypothetical protein [Streptomyces cellostaticus]|uniref:hypothetical protein n=1 Tax=Streptomyces cellostaticus TaxID=67285 RepID=UPI00131ADE81|nr:hypothetical protein [Streptomyces cellostaticus]
MKPPATMARGASRVWLPLRTLRTYERKRLIPALPEHGEPEVRRVELVAVTAVLPAGDAGLTECVRRCWSDLRATLEERTGAAPEEVRAFLAQELLLVVERALG